MKISQKVLLLIVIIGASFSIGGIFGIQLIQESFEKSISEKSTIIVNELMNGIDQSIYNRIEEFKLISTEKNIHNELEKSNNSFRALENPLEFINFQDEQWINSETETVTPFMLELLSNDISNDLRKKIEFYNDLYGYNLIGEIFVTNTFGANIAQSGKTSDYKQNDESWWINAKQNGLDVSDVDFDHSAKVYSTDISIRIDDEFGNLIGVMKVVLNIEEVINFLGEHEKTFLKENAGITLLDGSNRIIYTTNDFENFQDVSSHEIFRIIDGKSGNDIKNNVFSNGEDRLFAYTESRGYKDYPGLGWHLILDYDTDEILSPVNDLIQIISTLALGSFSIAVGASIFLARKFTKPIFDLKEAAENISKGNFDFQLETKGDDEIAQLNRQFENMRRQLKNSTEELNKKVRIRTKQLANFKSALDKYAIVAMTDLDGKITYVNEKFCDISKYPAEELIGQNHRMLKSGYHSREFFERMWKVITSGGVWRGEIKNKAKDGSYYWVYSIIAPLYDDFGNIDSFVAIRTDVTKQKEQQEIIEKNIEKLKEIDKSKEEFLAMMSHELKTPITPIMLWTDALKEPDMLGKLNAEQLDAVENIESCAGQLRDLVSDLFDVYKLDLDKMSFSKEEFSLNEVIKEVVENAQKLADSKEITILDFTKEEISVFSDKRRIQQVLRNLINNAIDFVPENEGKIIVEAKNEGQQIQFRVEDNGKGIEKEKQEHLFKKFYQTDTSYTREHGGSGLGLAICKGIVNGLGGKIWVESEPGNGSTFYFTILNSESTKKEELVTNN